MRSNLIVGAVPLELEVVWAVLWFAGEVKRLGSLDRPFSLYGGLFLLVRRLCLLEYSDKMLSLPGVSIFILGPVARNRPTVLMILPELLMMVMDSWNGILAVGAPVSGPGGRVSVEKPKIWSVALPEQYSSSPTP